MFLDRVPRSCPSGKLRIEGTAPSQNGIRALRGKGRDHMSETCSHLDQIKVTHTKKHVCEDCVKIGDTWVHLRMCLECGHVGCCDSSKNKHATKHFHAVRHPLMRSIEPGESWGWCYVDELELDFT